MYSSVYNNEYSKVYYDYLKTPVQINNRLAILTANNPFLLNFMGVRYLETSPSQVPAGYRVLWKNGTTGSLGKYVCTSGRLPDPGHHDRYPVQPD